MKSSISSFPLLAALVASLVYLAPAFANPVTFFSPYADRLEALSFLGHVDGGGTALLGGTAGVGRTFHADTTLAGTNPEGGELFVEATSSAYQLSSYGQTGIFFDGSAAAALSVTNPYDTWMFDYSVFDPSRAYSTFSLDFILTEATSFTFSATLSVLGGIPGDDSHYIYFGDLAHPATPLEYLTNSGSVFVSGLLQPGHYAVRSELITHTRVFFGPSEAEARGSFALNFLTGASAPVPEGGSTAAALLLSLGLCWQARRRVGACRARTFCD